MRERICLKLYCAMLNGHAIWFLTFADSRFDSWKRLGKQAKELGWFDKIIAGDERMFDDWYREKYASRFSDRGFGYWQWKSYLIRRELDKMNEDDVLVYCDGGCALNVSGYERFLEYVRMVSQSDSGVILFDQGMNPREWTKGDIFNYFSLNPDLLGNSQVAGGIIILKKCANSSSLINEWYYICHNHYELINDIPSKLPNYPEFVENRHDQCILNILAHKYRVLKLSFEELYRVDEDWSKMSKYPIWAIRQRDRKLSIKQKIKKILKWS